MPYTTLVSGTTITASWANANVRDQTISPFASTSARDTAITSPVTGMVTYISSNDANEGILTRATGSVWRQPWNLPWGHLAGAAVDTTMNTTSATVADWGGLTCSFTAITSRRYKVTATAVANAVTGTGVLLITDLSNNIYTRGDYSPNSSSNYGVTLTVYTISGISGSVGFKLRGSTSSGTFTLNPANGFQNRSAIWVEDIGPSGAPA